MKQKLEKYIKEATYADAYPDTGGIASDDDYPPGNINFGPRYVRKPYHNRLTGYANIWDVDDEGDFYWNWFENCTAMEDPDNYSGTLQGMNKLLGRDALGKHVRSQPLPDKEVEKQNRASLRLQAEPENQLGQMDTDHEDAPRKDGVVEKIDKALESEMRKVQ